MTRRIDLLAGTRNTPTTIDRLHSAHHSSEIVADGQIAARKSLECADACSAVIDRAEFVQVQPVSQLAGIDPVILVPLCAILPRIAYHQSRYVWLQQIVQPGGPSSFFQGDMQLTAQPVHKIQNDVGFRLDHTFHHQLPGIIPDRNRNAFLVHIHADIFSASHKRVFLSGGFEASTQTLLHKGRPFILRRLLGSDPLLTKQLFLPLVPLVIRCQNPAFKPAYAFASPTTFPSSPSTLPTTRTLRKLHFLQ